MSHNYVIEVDRHFAEIKASGKEMKENDTQYQYIILELFGIDLLRYKRA